jgi:hypothetical protein
LKPIDSCIEIGSGDMIDFDEDGNFDIDPSLVIDNYVDQNS